MYVLNSHLYFVCVEVMAPPPGPRQRRPNPTPRSTPRAAAAGRRGRSAGDAAAAAADHPRRPRGEDRCGGAGLLPFLGVLGTYVLVFVVPLLCAAALLLLGLLSFWPVVVVVLPFVFVAVVPALVTLAALAVVLLRWRRRETVAYLGSRAFLLLPFHAVFVTVVVSVFSIWWSLALGACLFVQGEVFWSRRSAPCLVAPRRKARVVDLFDRWSWPIFEYFPIRVRLADPPAPPAGAAAAEARHQQTLIMPAATADADAPPRCIFCYHPHGIYAVGLFSLVFGRSSGFARLWYKAAPARPLLVGVASALLHIPIVGRLVQWFGFVPASRAEMQAACRTEADVALVPGGIAEMVLAREPGVEKLYLRRRRGFVRMALQSGRALVPVYNFGENRVFKQYSCFRRTAEYLSRRFRLSIVFFRGRNCTLLPRQEEQLVVVGAPIPVPRIEDPPPEVVDRFHARYVAAVQRLFESHKHLHKHSRDLRLEIC